MEWKVFEKGSAEWRNIVILAGQQNGRLVCVGIASTSNARWCAASSWVRVKQDKERRTADPAHTTHTDTHGKERRDLAADVSIHGSWPWNSICRGACGKRTRKGAERRVSWTRMRRTRRGVVAFRRGGRFEQVQLSLKELLRQHTWTNEPLASIWCVDRPPLGDKEGGVERRLGGSLAATMKDFHF